VGQAWGGYEVVAAGERCVARQVSGAATASERWRWCKQRGGGGARRGQSELVNEMKCVGKREKGKHPISKPMNVWMVRFDPDRPHIFIDTDEYKITDE
jgi:hypothetical protein